MFQLLYWPVKSYAFGVSGAPRRQGASSARWQLCCCARVSVLSPAGSLVSCPNPFTRMRGLKLRENPLAKGRGLPHLQKSMRLMLVALGREDDTSFNEACKAPYLYANVGTE